MKSSLLWSFLEVRNVTCRMNQKYCVTPVFNMNIVPVFVPVANWEAEIQCDGSADKSHRLSFKNGKLGPNIWTSWDSLPNSDSEMMPPGTDTCRYSIWTLKRNPCAYFWIICSQKNKKKIICHFLNLSFFSLSLISLEFFILECAVRRLLTFCQGSAAGHQSLAAVTSANIKCCFLSLLSSWDALWWQLEWNKKPQSIESARGNNYFVYNSLFIVNNWIQTHFLEQSFIAAMLMKHICSGNKSQHANDVFFLVHGWTAQLSPLLGSWTRRSPDSQVWT